MAEIKWAKARIGGETHPNDFVATDDQGRKVGRIYLMQHGPQGDRWFWVMQGEPPAFDRNRATCVGYADGKQAAADEVRRVYAACLVEGS